MFLKPYQIIKSALGNIDGISLITWYNNQIDAGVLHTAPAILIEFPNDLVAETLNRQNQQAELIIRVHLVSKIHTDKDGSVADVMMIAHQQLADLIFDELQGLHFDDASGAVINSMMRVGVRLDMNAPGWAVTWQDFMCELYLHEVSLDYTLYPKPDPLIIDET